MALAVLLYAYDCAVLLYANEGLLSGAPPRPARAPHGRERWRARCPRGLLQIGGRFLYLQNPLTPQRPAFRLSCSFALGAGAATTSAMAEVPTAVATADLAEAAQSLARLAPLTATAALALGVLLPLGLFSPLGARMLMPALVLLYGSIAAAVGMLYARRAAFSLTRRQCVVLAFECLACPPFGVNLIRRIALAKRWPVPFPDVAARLLEPGRWQQLERELEAELGAELAALDDDDVTRAGLEAQLRRLRTLGSASAGTDP